MSESRRKSGFKQKGYESSNVTETSPSRVFGGFWLLLFLGTLLVGGPWGGYHAVLLAGAALLMFFFPPIVGLPRIWWVLAGLVVILSMGAFLPAAWFPAPEWRGKLVALGLDAGSQVVLQPRHAAEALFLWVVTLLTGMWLAGHRPSPQQVRLWALMFTSGVAVYAVLSMIKYEPRGVFGFFPNRNHTATYLAMGAICGLGCILQALRDMRFVTLGISLVMTSICLWAVAGWSISRGGVLLVVIGSLIWVSLLGKRYLGKHGMRALGLIAFAVVGFFFIADSSVKHRIAKTVEKANAISVNTEEAGPAHEKQSENALTDLDFRVPIALETLNLIQDFKLTGVGAGQFKYVFPQYRELTAVANNTQALHPESDWLLMAAELGIPATLGFLLLVGCAFWLAIGGLFEGNDRALRAGCLIAAALVPLHGFFDVPGHRMALAWCSGFLFVLSLHTSSDKRSKKSLLRSGLFRGTALVMATVAFLLARAEWWNGKQPASTVAPSATANAWKAQTEDVALRKKATDSGIIYQPETKDDPLYAATEVLQQAREVTPLDSDVLFALGYNSLFFEVPLESIDRTFALQRALNPTRIDAPLQQSYVWINTDPARTAQLWSEAILRSEHMNSIAPNERWKAATMDRIRHMAKKRPDLQVLIPEQHE